VSSSRIAPVTAAAPSEIFNEVDSDANAGKSFDHHLCAECGCIRSERYHKMHNVNPGRRPPAGICRPCLRKYKKSQDAEFHACWSCGIIRSQAYHQRHPIPDGGAAADPNYCQACTANRIRLENLDISLLPLESTIGVVSLLNFLCYELGRRLLTHRHSLHPVLSSARPPPDHLLTPHVNPAYSLRHLSRQQSASSLTRIPGTATMASQRLARIDPCHMPPGSPPTIVGQHEATPTLNSQLKINP
jgi:hypothetical protein